MLSISHEALEVTKIYSVSGMLFLDELPEFGQQTLEVLRQPFEDRIAHLSIGTSIDLSTS